MRMGRQGVAVICVAAAFSARAAAQDTTAVAVDTAVVTDTVIASADTSPAVTDTRMRGGSSFHASPLLPEDHWAVRAAWRAEALGLTRFLPAQRAVPRAEVARALAEAAANASSPSLRALATGWEARFVEEFPEYGLANRASGPVTLLGGQAAAGVDDASGRVGAVIGYQINRQDPRPLPDVSAARVSLLGGVALPWASASAEGAYRGGEAVLRQWDVAVGAGPFQLSVGRAPVGYGYGRTGGIVYSDPDALPRIELQTTRPFRLPSLLRYLGPVTLHTFAGPVNDPARHPTNPDLWGLRAAMQPHPRVTLAINRGSMFGGDAEPVTAGRVLRMLVGVVHSRFENQILSLEGRYRLPTETVVPATLYVEWGADDAAGALDEEPARIIGLFLPALPGVPNAALGAEYTYFKHACCGHGVWYTSATFRGNWAVHDRPLGHPLGGEGAEYAAYVQGDALDARLRLDARAFLRDRSDYSLHIPRYNGGNLYTPTRTGRSEGGRLDAAFRLFPRAEARARWQLEHGDWGTEHSLQATFAWLF
ncbi:capsule assembly Wzi family protein [Longimicrobium sp.]|uniref:capsule assembly Wzi family protein n=1 Tax=Longimicrobium sp. TaxID=2029185 RepID=UPI002BC90D92|nr:capsule assembly Wzi family protein [Longimicrobium sp.]HSU17107.1 capsule assembly Wzi family protein [Longimicrobium sp.]